jgi:hypothetical protein
MNLSFSVCSWKSRELLDQPSTYPFLQKYFALFGSYLCVCNRICGYRFIAFGSLSYMVVNYRHINEVKFFEGVCSDHETEYFSSFCFHC